MCDGEGSMFEFERYLGIDYSGAGTPESRLSGLRVFEASQSFGAREVKSEEGSGRNWSRLELSEWLLRSLSSEVPMLVGIDHGFSFPSAYFERHGLSLNWDDFLRDFREYWPTDQIGVKVQGFRRQSDGMPNPRSGSSKWRRLCEIRCHAKSVFHFDVPGSVAKSTHAGLPWLLWLREQLGQRVHFWPFDGWIPRRGVSVLAEAYPSLWNGNHSIPPGWNAHQFDAWCLVDWMQRADAAGNLGSFFSPHLDDPTREIARYEGWILGLKGDPQQS